MLSRNDPQSLHNRLTLWPSCASVFQKWPLIWGYVENVKTENPDLTKKFFSCKVHIVARAKRKGRGARVS